MFSGIIKDIGKIHRMIDADAISDTQFMIRTRLPLAKLAIGASVACDGACLTVVASQACDSENEFVVEVSQASFAVSKLSDWQVGSHVNLEPALSLQDGIDGHLVTGHVDTVAVLHEMIVKGGSVEMQFRFDAKLSHFVAAKGSITVEGVSLTVNEVFAHAEGVDAIFVCNIISRTLNATNLGKKSLGSRLNMEIDLLARYVERVLLAKTS